LLTQEEVLGDQVGAAADDGQGHGDEQGEELGHGRAMMARRAAD
jgi:hypothetical protein